MVVQSNGSALVIRAGRPLANSRHPWELLLRVVHGDIAVSHVDGSSGSLAYDQGQITQIGDAQIALVRRNGGTVQLTWDDSTFVPEEGHRGSVGDLETGDVAMFVSERGHAGLIWCIRPGGA